MGTTITRNEYHLFIKILVQFPIVSHIIINILLFFLTHLPGNCEVLIGTECILRTLSKLQKLRKGIGK